MRYSCTRFQPDRATNPKLVYCSCRLWLLLLSADCCRHAVCRVLLLLAAAGCCNCLLLLPAAATCLEVPACCCLMLPA